MFSPLFIYRYYISYKFNNYCNGNRGIYLTSFGGQCTDPAVGSVCVPELGTNTVCASDCPLPRCRVCTYQCLLKADSPLTITVTMNGSAFGMCVLAVLSVKFSYSTLHNVFFLIVHSPNLASNQSNATIKSQSLPSLHSRCKN